MKVWLYQGGRIDNKISYLHLVTGPKDDQGRVKIERSILEFGSPKQNFQKPGETIMIGTAQILLEYSDLKKQIISGIFEDLFDLKSNVFRVLE